MTLPPLKEFDFSRYPMICAHRGDTSLGAKENTIAAIEAAISSGAEMIEVDVQFTAKGEIVCHHDELLGEQEYDSFEKMLEIAVGSCYLNIELKGYGAVDELALLPNLFDLVKKHRLSEYVLYSSFRPDYISEISNVAITTIIHPTNEMSELIGIKEIENILPSELIKQTGAATYAAQLSELDSRRVNDIRENHLHLSVYTINTKADYDKAVMLGAQAVVTDVPRSLVSIRNETYTPNSFK